MKFSCTCFLLIFGCLLTANAGAGTLDNPTSTWKILFSDDFENGDDNWEMEPGTAILSEPGNHFLKSEGHYTAALRTGQQWANYLFAFKLKLIKGIARINFRVEHTPYIHVSYALHVHEYGISLTYDAPQYSDRMIRWKNQIKTD